MTDKEKKGGYVLVVALVTTISLGMVATGMVSLTLQERRLAARSSAYSRALYAAESGADLACEEFSKQSTGGSAWSGWASSGAFKSSSTNLTGGAQFSVTASNSTDFCTITSTGTVSIAGITVQRVVKVAVQRVQNTPQFFKYGVLSAGPVEITGSSLFDSFDSTDPAKSSNGQYDPAKACETATLATLSTGTVTVAKNGKVTVTPAFAISGAALVKGNVSVAPGGAVSMSGSASVTGMITYDAAQELSDVVVPFSLPPTGTINVGPYPNQEQTMTVSGSQDMSVTRFDVIYGGKLTIMGSGRLRIYVDGKTTVSGSGSIEIKPNPSTADLKVEIYANDDVSISGSGMVNDTYRAVNCAIWGTENCTKISMTGNAAYIGTIYAPYASVNLTGSSSATGAFLGALVTFGGNTPYHIDESLIGSSSSSSSSGSGKPYRLLSWGEL